MLSDAVQIDGVVGFDAAFQREPADLLLVADVLGRQLIDLRRVQLVRAREIELVRRDGRWLLAGVHVASGGWWHQLRRGRFNPRPCLSHLERGGAVLMKNRWWPRLGRPRQLLRPRQYGGDSGGLDDRSQSYCCVAAGSVHRPRRHKVTLVSVQSALSVEGRAAQYRRVPPHRHDALQPRSIRSDRL